MCMCGTHAPAKQLPRHAPLSEDELTAGAHFPKKLLHEERVPQRPRIDLVHQRPVEATAREQCPHELGAIRAVEGLQLDL